jgi:hypothetical protein
MRLVSLSLALLCPLILGACDIAPSSSNVKLSEAPAEGLTESSFDQSYLDRLIAETREEASQRLEARYESNKVPHQERISRAETSGRYEHLGDHRLAVIDLSYSANPMRVTRVVGIQQDRLITISCISPMGEPIDLLDEEGECSQAVREHFLAAR